MLDRLESQIFSLIKSKFSPTLKKNYPDLNFTTSDRAPTEAKFPTVYVHLMESPEAAQTLSGASLNAVNATFQIEITDNQKQARADEISKEILRIMKTLRFNAAMIPIHNNTGEVYRTVSRYRRMIGEGDIL